MGEEQTKISMQLDLGVDLRHMYDMILSMHSEFRSRHEHYAEMSEQLSLHREQIELLQEKIEELEQENRRLHEQQDTLLAHVWDVDVVWLEEWFLQCEPNVIRLFCAEEAHSNTNRLGIVSRCGSWNNILELWEYLARCCEQDVREATQQEQRALDVVLRIFNTSQRAKKATLQIPEMGEICIARMHTNIHGDGEQITLVVLPGLYNVQGELKTKALVCTSNINS